MSSTFPPLIKGALIFSQMVPNELLAFRINLLKPANVY